MNFNNIIVEKGENLGQITINRPKKLNALNKETIAELSLAFKLLEDDSEVKVIILTGSGDKAFVAGADISEFAHFSEDEGGVLARKGQEMLFNFVENLSTPVIAAVNGFALAGFVDMGDAFDNRIDYKRGAGIGLRWRLPFGALRLDAASALDLDGQPFRLHFSFGTDL